MKTDFRTSQFTYERVSGGLKLTNQQVAQGYPVTILGPIYTKQKICIINNINIPNK